MFSIAIPSYKRSETLNKKTLTALKNEGFLPHQITVFVANEEERESYLRNLDPSLYGTLVVGVLGIGNQRKFILEHYPLGHPILMVDDDVRKFKKIGEWHLPTLFQKTFDYCLREGIPAWSLYPVSNPLSMKSRIRVGLHLLVGSCFGVFATEGPDYSGCPHGVKEDYVTSFVLYQASKKLLRLEFLAVDTTYWNGKGGLQGIRTDDIERQASEYLARLYPQFVKDVYTRKNGRPDIHLRKLPVFLLPPETLA